MSFEIIDFHTHPFVEPLHNICSHKEFCHMGPEDTRNVFASLGISRICGSVITTSPFEDTWRKICRNNDTALLLRERYGDFYVPGFHVHPAYPQGSTSTPPIPRSPWRRSVGWTGWG